CRIRLDEDGTAKFIIRHDGKTLNAVQAPFWSTAGVNPEDFVTYSGDLDNDGISEVILVSHDAVGNGMGVTYSTVHVFPDPIRFPDESPISFPVQEFGRKDTFVFDEKLKRVLILITYWKDYKTLDKG